MSVSGTKEKKSDPPKPNPEPKKKPDPPKKDPQPPSDQFEKKNGSSPKNAPQLNPSSGQGGGGLQLTVSHPPVKASQIQGLQQIGATPVTGNTVVAGQGGQAVAMTPPTPPTPISPSQLAERFGLPDPAQPPPVGPVKPEGPPVCVAEPPAAATPPPTGPAIGPASPEAVQQLEEQKLASAGMVPAIPSSSGTVVVTGNSMTEPEKLAAGAIKITPETDPNTIDGMYVGSDGFAYPPDKFTPSQVPPYAPDNPVSNPPPATYYVNGIITNPAAADWEARQLANQSGTNVVLIYNATEQTNPDDKVGMALDIAQTEMDRLGMGNNPATQTLANAINQDLAAGLNVNVMGYSQGGAIVSSALRQVDPQQMGNINVVGIAGAGEVWPEGPRYTFYVNQYDVVPNMLGVHDSPIWDAVNVGIGLLNPALPAVTGLGSTPPGADVHVIDEPAKGMEDPISPHYLTAYLDHIAKP